MLPLILAFYYAQITSGNITPTIVQDYIVAESLAAGVDPQLSLHIVRNESGFNPNAVGDHGESEGAWQVHLPAHLDISPEQAKDIVWSTQWSLNQLKKGNCKIWSTCPSQSI